MKRKREEEKNDSPNKELKLNDYRHCFLLDGDGSVFNPTYLLLLKNKPNENPVISGNKPLTNLINGYIDLHKLKKVSFGDGSNRQSLEIDRYCCNQDESWPTESFFQALLHLKEHIEQQHPAVEFDLNTFLLCDITHNLPIGTGFDRALKALNQIEVHASTILDHSKLMLLWAWFQRLTLQYPDEPLYVHFLDDQTSILTNLLLFLKKHLTLIPLQVELVLHFYAGGRIKTALSLKGTGESYPDYGARMRNLWRAYYPKILLQQKKTMKWKDLTWTCPVNMLAYFQETGDQLSEFLAQPGEEYVTALTKEDLQKRYLHAQLEMPFDKQPLDWEALFFKACEKNDTFVIQLLCPDLVDLSRIDRSSLSEDMLNTIKKAGIEIPTYLTEETTFSFSK